MKLFLLFLTFFLFCCHFSFGATPIIKVYYETDYDTPVYSSGDNFPTDDDELNSIVDGITDMYNLLNNMFEYQSFDGEDSEIIIARDTTTNEMSWHAEWNANIPSPGTDSDEYVSYSSGWGSYDLVIRALSFGIARYSDNPYPAYESGSLALSFGEILAETVQIINEYNDEDYSVRNDGHCPSSSASSHR